MSRGYWPLALWSQAPRWPGTVQICSLCPDKIVNSASSRAQRCPSLDEKWPGHPAYLLFTNSLLQPLLEPWETALCAWTWPSCLSTFLSLECFPRVLLSEAPLRMSCFFVCLPASTLPVSLYSPVSFCLIGDFMFFTLDLWEHLV